MGGGKTMGIVESLLVLSALVNVIILVIVVIILDTLL